MEAHETLQTGMKLLHPFGLPTHKETIIWICIAVSILKVSKERCLGDELSAKQLDVAKAEIREFGYSRGWGKSRVANLVKDSLSCFDFLDRVLTNDLGTNWNQTATPPAIIKSMETRRIVNSKTLREAAGSVNECS